MIYLQLLLKTVFGLSSINDIHSMGHRKPLEYSGAWDEGMPAGGRADNCATTFVKRKWVTTSCEERYNYGP
jgi:hypothetical protein